MENILKFKNIVPTLLLIVSTTASAATLEGKAIRVIDGDTIVVLSEAHHKYRVRLANIDCPEKRQPWGNKAKRATSKLVGNKPVVVEWQKLDRYSRLIGTVYQVGANVNRALVAEGHCWVYEKYNQDGQLPDLQVQAKAQNKGLWKLPEYDRTPPWEWRKKRKEK